MPTTREPTLDLPRPQVSRASRRSDPTRPCPPNTFSTAPIQRLLQHRAAEHNLSLLELADVLRVPHRTLVRVLSRPQLRWDTADRLAVALGHHPGELWPTWHPSTRQEQA